MKLGLIGGAYSSGSKPLSAQECVNLYPEVAEGGGRNNASLMPTPGNVAFSNIGTQPVRGMLAVRGILYAVAGQFLYSVSSLGTATSLGSVTGFGRVSMSYNNNGHLIVSNGTDAWIYDGTFAADDDFPGGHVFAYLDGYTLTNEPGTRKFYASGADNFVWNPLDFASKEGDATFLVTGAENNEDLILFGEKTIEFWRDTGDSDFQFEKQTGVSQERGCGAEHSVANLDNTIYFLGDDKIAYKLDGYRPVRISDHGIENFLEGIDISEATAFTYTRRGHYFYVVNVGGKTWVYDATFSQQTQRNTWHEGRSGISRWRGENYVGCYGRHLVGDYATGIIWELTGLTDDGAEIHRVRSLAPISSDIRQLHISRLELKLKSGIGTQVWLEISKDGGRTWSDRILKSTGAIGEYMTQVVWRRLGVARDWAFRFTTTDGDVNWIECYADAEVGEG